MSQQLSGKTVLVTGGSRGIGREITLGVARAGANVVSCYRQEGEHIEHLAGELKNIPGDHQLVRADVTVPAEVEQLVAGVRDGYGALHGIVHNAGVISHVPFGQLPLDEWHRVVDTSLTAAYLVINRALPLLSEGSSVVAIGSRVATVGIPLRSHYTAAKSALIGLVRGLTKELGPSGIRVNLVSPGMIETPEAAAKLSPEQRRAYEERYADIIAMGRFGRPQDIAEAVLFLLSDRSAYITGENINVDGGI
ncbi:MULTISPECIES: SDR family NAD(P)-dependent oxidoreductase [unclassified Nonomuraea]|uniref:SDR family NAD(P)-dependent oxidoreductase n=1 Tax=unclassified Nonomuraea TaxID=2593643 RepID=UPI0034448484